MNFTTVSGIENIIYVDPTPKTIPQAKQAIVNTGGFMFMYLQQEGLEVAKKHIVDPEEQRIITELCYEKKGFILGFKEAMDLLDEDELFAILAHEDGHLKHRHFENVQKTNLVQNFIMDDIDKELEADSYAVSLVGKKVLKKALKKAMEHTYELQVELIRTNPFVEDADRMIENFRKHFFNSEAMLRRLEALS